MSSTPSTETGRPVATNQKTVERVGHTPGPWERLPVQPGGVRKVVFVAPLGGGGSIGRALAKWTVAEVWAGPPCERVEDAEAASEANAHLISAAPDLLEACKRKRAAESRLCDWHGLTDRQRREAGHESEHAAAVIEDNEASHAMDTAVAKAEGLVQP